MISNVDSEAAGNGDDLSSLGDASPMDDADATQQQAQQAQLARMKQCRSTVQKYCSISFVAIYILVYFSLSSNPKVVLVSSNYQYDVHMAAAEGSRPALGVNAVNAVNATAEQRAKMRNDHLQQVASTIAREYEPVSPSTWCIDGRLKFEQAKRRPMGLCYVKVPRAASSTLVGINVRIARNFAARQGLRSCIRHDGPTPGFYYRQREPGLSFLWTFVRDPTSRAMSRVASNAAKNQLELPAVRQTNETSHLEKTTTYVLGTLQSSNDAQFGTISQGMGGFQLQYTSMRLIEEYSSWNAPEPTKVHDARRTQHTVREIFDRYDFIGVVERFDESLVALQLILGLTTSDILYFSSRMPNQYVGQQIPGRNDLFCQPLLDPRVLRTPKVEQYLVSTPWWAQHYGDHLLHEAASQSLDQTIMKIGLEEFSKAYKTFRSMLQAARQMCHPIFPCSTNGTDQSVKAEDDCYFEDIGCGYPCLDQMPAQ